MIRTVSYLRVSDPKQVQKDVSIPAQRTATGHWLAAHEDHTLVQEFVDEGRSAYKPADRRPGFCRMADFCKREDVDVVLVHSFDRFARNREDSVVYKALLRRHGVKVLSVTEPFDSDTLHGGLMEHTIENFNEFYSKMLAFHTKKGMRQVAEEGYFNGGRIPYGYQSVEVLTASGAARRRLIPGDPEEVKVVRNMLEWQVNENLGCRRTADRLNREGVPAPLGGNWNASSIDSLLSNAVYVGDTVWLMRGKVGRTKTVRNEPEDWVVVQNTHEALLDRELWEKRQALSAGRRFQTCSPKRRPHKYLLSSVIRCEHCGSNFVGRRQKYTDRKGVTSDLFRYYCGGYLSKGRSVCPSLPIKKDWVEGLVFDLIRQQLCSPEALADLEGRVRERIEARRHKYGRSAQEVTRQVAYQLPSPGLQ